MGRRRKHRLDLPQRFYCDRGTYYYWPPGRPKIWFRHKDGSPMALFEALAEYGKIIDRPATYRTLGDLMDQYSRLEIPKLKPRTQQDRLQEIGKLRAVFGEMDPLEITPQDIYGYKRARAAAPIRCNRELSALSALFSYGIENGLAVAANPCREVKRYAERERDRCPEPAELAAFIVLCRDRFGDSQTASYVELKRMVGLRMGDMLRLHRSMIQDLGLRIDTGKRGKKHFFPFTDHSGQSTGLRELLDEILALPRPVGSMWLFCGRRGMPYTVSGWKTMWQRRMRAYVDVGGVRFWEHDIRATAGTEVEEERGAEEAQKLLGHSDLRTTRVYTGRRKVIVVLPNRKRG